MNLKRPLFTSPTISILILKTSFCRGVSEQWGHRTFLLECYFGLIRRTTKVEKIFSGGVNWGIIFTTKLHLQRVGRGKIVNWNQHHATALILWTAVLGSLVFPMDSFALTATHLKVLLEAKFDLKRTQRRLIRNNIQSKISTLQYAQ